MLLDTHVWLWAVDGSPKLGGKTRRRLDKASRSLQGEVCVSAVSAFEIAALHTTGRVQLNQPVERWMREAIDRAKLRVIDLEPDIALDAGSIPATALPDPFDRCLVATAREYAMPLVTCDRRLLDYAKRTRMVTVIDASV